MTVNRASRMVCGTRDYYKSGRKCDRRNDLPTADMSRKEMELYEKL